MVLLEELSGKMVLLELLSGVNGIIRGVIRG